MDPHTLTRLAGIVGGLCWLGRLLLDLDGHGAGVATGALHWGGSVLVAVALVGIGAATVSSSATWLRAIVAVAFPLLVWSVLEVLHGAADPALVDGIAGVVVAAAGVKGLVASRDDADDSPDDADELPGGGRGPGAPGHRRADRRRTRPPRGAHAR